MKLSLFDVVARAAICLLASPLPACKAEPAGQSGKPASEQSRAAGSPYGVWVSMVGNTKTSLQFAGSPAGGTYSQLVEWPEGTQREFGHWVPDVGSVRLITLTL